MSLVSIKMGSLPLLVQVLEIMFVMFLTSVTSLPFVRVPKDNVFVNVNDLIAIIYNSRTTDNINVIPDLWSQINVGLCLRQILAYEKSLLH